MTQPVKFCPRCKTPAAINAPVCQNVACGHAFRTVFTPPDQTVMGALPTMPKKRTPWIALTLTGCCAFPLLAVMLLGLLSLAVPKTKHIPAGPKTITLASEMKAIPNVTMDQIFRRYGDGSNVINQSVMGQDYLIFFFRTEDGAVQIYWNKSFKAIERIEASGT